jgi:hypothetical protein
MAPLEKNKLAQLVIARLLVAGEKGASGADIRKSLEPLVGHRFAGAGLVERIDATSADLEACGLVERIGSGTAKRRTEKRGLTAEGRRRALECLGLAQLPPKTTWDKLKKTYLAAVALGLPAPEGKAATGFGGDNGFKAALLKATFDLPLAEFPTFDQAIDGLIRTLLEIPPAAKLDAKAMKTALLRRELGEARSADPKPDPKKEATRLLAKRVGARQAGKDELRLAAIREWIDRDSDTAPAVTNASPPEPPVETTPPVLELHAFARRVVDAARTCPTGRFGDNKVFVAHVWQLLQGDPAFAALGVEAFKRRLAEANNAGLLNLSRADLVEAMDPEDVRRSEVPYLGATFHFVRI